MTIAYLGLGSNLGDRALNLKLARTQLEALGVLVKRFTSIEETEPFGVTDQPAFLNQVLEIEFAGAPRELLAIAKQVEAALGRTPTYRWGPRVIDVDILLFGDLTLAEPDLQIPHPGLHDRAFLRKQLSELRPDILGS